MVRFLVFVDNPIFLELLGVMNKFLTMQTSGHFTIYGNTIAETDTTVTIVASPQSPLDRRLIQQFFELRSTVFIDQLGWKSLTKVSKSEVDEYDDDSVFFVFIISKPTKTILAGMRVGPTDKESYRSPLALNPSSYMIRDAHLGRLEEFTSPLCYRDPPQSDEAIELTRLISTHPSNLEALVLDSSKMFAENGITECFILASPTFLRWGRRLGFVVTRRSDDLGEGRAKFCAMSYNPKKDVSNV